MPRATRSQVASARRSDPSSSDAAPVPAPVSNDKAPIRSDSTDIYGVSDREIERQRKANETSITVAAQAAAPTTARSTRSRANISTNAMDCIALETSKKRRDAAMSKLADLTSTTNDDAADLSEDGVEAGRRGSELDASSLLGPRRLSGMEIMDDEIFGNLEDSIDQTNHPDKDSTSNTGTRSADTSAFNVGVFRRRRQSSIVGKDDAPIRPSSRGPTTPGLSSTFNLGNFRRRRRQPSILLSSAQKASVSVQRSRAASEDENAVQSEGEEESFLPEAEGTPVRQSRGRISDAERAADEVDGQLETRSKKRKSTESHESEATKRQAVEAEHEQLVQQSIEIDEQSSPPSFVEQRRRANLELDDAIFAPPESSTSPEGSPTIWPSLKNLGKKHHGDAPSRANRTPTLDDDMSDLSEPPSLTHSPNLKPQTGKPSARNNSKPAQRRQSPKISTADLEALLPRRRRKGLREAMASEDEGAELVSEEEERAPRPPRKKPAQPLNGSSNANKTNQAKETNTSRPMRTTRRVYGSRKFDEDTTQGDTIVAAGDSTPLDETAFEADVNEESTTNLDLGDELKAASRKFKEVDQWELDFEEVVESSSPLPEGR